MNAFVTIFIAIRCQQDEASLIHPHRGQFMHTELPAGGGSGWADEMKIIC